jgi:hypothetical protein
MALRGCPRSLCSHSSECARQDTDIIDFAHRQKPLACNFKAVRVSGQLGLKLSWLCWRWDGSGGSGHVGSRVSRLMVHVFKNLQFTIELI